MLTDKHLDFRPKHSSVTVLASFADDVLSNMERGNLCGAVFLDLSKAFDTVDHSILLAKLCSLGLTPNAVQWFQSYLSHRKQRTSLRQRDLRSSTFYPSSETQGQIVGTRKSLNGRKNIWHEEK